MECLLWKWRPGNKDRDRNPTLRNKERRKKKKERSSFNEKFSNFSLFSSKPTQSLPFFLPSKTLIYKRTPRGETSEFVPNFPFLTVLPPLLRKSVFVVHTMSRYVSLTLKGNSFPFSWHSSANIHDDFSPPDHLFRIRNTVFIDLNLVNVVCARTGSPNSRVLQLKEYTVHPWLRTFDGVNLGLYVIYRLSVWT